MASVWIAQLGTFAFHLFCFARLIPKRATCSGPSVDEGEVEELEARREELLYKQRVLQRQIDKLSLERSARSTECAYSDEEEDASHDAHGEARQRHPHPPRLTTTRRADPAHATDSWDSAIDSPIVAGGWKSPSAASLLEMAEEAEEEYSTAAPAPPRGSRPQRDSSPRKRSFGTRRADGR